MAIKKLKEFLDNHQIKYVTIIHSPAYTAQEVAESVHISGKRLAKSVIVKVANRLVMIVIAASEQLNFAKLSEVFGVNPIELATESEFKDQFPGCDIGSMPPFGNLFGLPVFISKNLSKQNEIVFSAGLYTEVLQLSYSDYEILVRPKVIQF